MEQKTLQKTERPMPEMKRLEKLKNSLREAEGKMLPATIQDIQRILEPNLMNVVPSGMSLDERKSWYKAAFLRLSQLGIPADLLEQGAIASFVKADHPAKIIKLIWNEIEGTLEARKASLKSLQSLVQNANAPRLNHKPVELDPDERREVSATLGSLTAEFTKRANAERQI